MADSLLRVMQDFDHQPYEAHLQKTEPDTDHM